MNKRVKKLWIADLKSGEIKQAEGALRKNKARCCLGVLCDVFRRDTGKGAWRRDACGDWEFIVDGQHAIYTLPRSVQQWARIKDDNPALGDDLAGSLNDNSVPFTDIADRIEKYL